MKFASNGQNEIFFVDGAETALTPAHFNALTSASAHFLQLFNITTEVDVYISKRSVLHTLADPARVKAWHMPPSYDRENSIVCVFVDPNGTVKDMIISLAHEMIHAWQVDRGDLLGANWKGNDLTHLPYNLQPWEIEAHGNMVEVAQTFFDGEMMSPDKLKSIINATDQVFAKILSEVKSLHTKQSVMKIAKVAGALGLGALIGM